MKTESDESGPFLSVYVLLEVAAACDGWRKVRRERRPKSGGRWVWAGMARAPSVLDEVARQPMDKRCCPTSSPSALPSAIINQPSQDDNDENPSHHQDLLWGWEAFPLRKRADKSHQHLFNMSDDAFMQASDEEEYDFEFEDDDDEQDSGAVDIENKYYNAKQLKLSDPEEAIDEFLGIPPIETEKGEWGFKGLKQANTTNQSCPDLTVASRAINKQTQHQTTHKKQNNQHTQQHKKNKQQHAG